MWDIRNSLISIDIQRHTLRLDQGRAEGCDFGCRLGHSVVCTDIGDVVEQMQRTFEREALENARACELCWGVKSLVSVGWIETRCVFR